MNAAELNRVAKTQWIRVADVALIGPLMFGGGVELRRTRPIMGLLLAGLGLATVGYNAYNYVRVAEAQRSDHGKAG